MGSSSLPIDRAFFPVVDELATRDKSVRNKLAKERNRLHAYATSLGLPADSLLLQHVWEGKRLNAKLEAFIDSLPVKRSKSPARARKYRSEIKANVGHLVRAVVAHVEQLVGEQNDGGAGRREEMPSHPVLAKVFDLLPRRLEFRGPGKVYRTDALTPAGGLLYSAFKQVVERRPADSLEDFLAKRRGEVNAFFREGLPPRKARRHQIRADNIFRELRREVGLSPLREPSNKLLLEELPSPLREQIKMLGRAFEGVVDPDVRKRAGAYGVTLKKRVSFATFNSAKESIGRFVARLSVEGSLGVADILRTTKSEEVLPNGKKIPIYSNPYLDPYREEERARESRFKRAGYDSAHFVRLVTLLQSVARYSGEFDCLEHVDEAFRPDLDEQRIEDNKALKKSLISRHELWAWLGEQWSRYEQIVLSQSFRRQETPGPDGVRRPDPDSDENMRFVLFYLMLVTLLTQGYRQRQLRDCAYGVDLFLPKNGIRLYYAAEKTKMEKGLECEVFLPACERTHGLLIKAHHLYAKWVYPYVQENYAPWETGDPERDAHLDPRGQVFVYPDWRGKFKRHDPLDGKSVTAKFKEWGSVFLEGSRFSWEALDVIHPHYLRGASMDVFFLDRGGTPEEGAKFYGATERTIDRKYRDRRAPLNASHSLVDMNLRLAQREAIAGDDGLEAKLEKMQEEHRRRERYLMKQNDALAKQLDDATKGRDQDRLKELEAKLDAKLDAQLEAMMKVLASDDDE